MLSTRDGRETPDTNARSGQRRTSGNPRSTSPARWNGGPVSQRGALDSSSQSCTDGIGLAVERFGDIDERGIGFLDRFVDDPLTGFAKAVCIALGEDIEDERITGSVVGR